MCRKMTYLMSLVLMLGLSAVSEGGTEVAHWPLDNDAMDAVGGIHGTLMNGASFTTDAVVGSHALELDGADDYVDFGNPQTLPSGYAERTMCAWGRTDTVAAGWAWIASYGRGGVAAGEAMFLGRNGSTLYGGGMYDDVLLSGFWEVGVWHHLCLTYDGTTAILYADGVEVTRAAKNWNLVLNNVYLGRQCFHTGENWDGTVDDVHIYSRVLTPDQIQDLYNGIAPDFKKAWNPSPPDGAPAVTLALFGWEAGDDAAYHDIYLGTNPTPGPAEYIKRQGVSFKVYYHEPGLVPGTTYYWRIDEVEADGATVHTGDVWSCTAAPLAAYSPDPPDGAKYVFTDAVLSWSPGTTAHTHDVYLGTDETEVANGTPGTFTGNWSVTSYDPGGLARDTTYYWRVDEVESNGVIKHTGNVWRFKTIPDTAISDPNLVAWWKLDEGQGAMVLDWSGHEHHGTLLNGPQWVAGYDGGALDLDGSDDYVDFGNPPDLPSGYAARSICGWGKTDTVASGYRWIAAYGSPATSQACFIGMLDDDLVSGGYGGDDVSMPGYWQVGEWHHICLTYDGATGRLYADGVQVGSAAKTWDLALSRVHIGRQVNTAAEFWNGLVDDVRIYSKALTLDEIKQAMRGDPTLAWNPKPWRGAMVDIEHATPLSWSPGEKASRHDVYFGTDADAVSDADASDATGVYRGRQDPNSYTPSETLKGNQTYYWRVDEINNDATISEGRLWNFTVTDYLIVDDFEPYDDYCNRIFYAWTDGWGYSADPSCGVAASAGNGTGSTVGNLTFPYAEQTIVHSGRQSMPFEYNNTGTGGKARYSEAQREWAAPQDWTRKAVKALTLYFYGDPANAAEQLYVALQDNTGQVKVVNRPNLDAVQGGAWQEWNIELTQFSGVNLKAVKKMYIGLGNRVSPAVGGTGKIYIDDIRLYAPRCVPLMLRPDADIAEPYDCKVDYKDLRILGDEWLLETQLQDWQERAAYWDSRYRTNWASEADSIAVRDGLAAAGYTILDADQLKAWMDARIADGKLSVVVFCRDNAPDTVVESVDATCTLRKYLDAGGKIVFYADIPFWDIAHADGTWDNPQTAGASDILGFDNTVVLWDSNTEVTLTAAGANCGLTQTWASVRPIATTDVTVLATDAAGNAAAWARHYLPGDTARGFVRLWDRTGHPPVGDIIRAAESRLAADLHQDGVVDFKDFAVFADAWLEEILWP